MDVYEAIENRRSIRVFTQAISEEQLRRLLLAGTKAPSGSNVQPWEFIIIDDPNIIEQIAEHKYQQSLKMVIDQMVLADPKTIEHIYLQKQEKLELILPKNFVKNSLIMVCLAFMFTPWEKGLPLRNF